MGTMTYAGTTVEFDDRVLTHLHVVIMQKFRRGESFPMSWIDAVSIGSGRGALWMTPATPVCFRFEVSRAPEIDGDWIRRLLQSADGSRGLIVTDADGTPVRATGLGHRRGVVGVG